MKSKKILVIIGHPSKKSLNKAIADKYVFGVRKSGGNINIKRINLYDLKFDLVLHEGYNKIQELEPDLEDSWEKIKWAEHIVFIFPIWWGTMPALMKGFIDRVFLPGYAFTDVGESGFPKKRLLKGKTSSLIITGGGPRWLYFLFGNFFTLPFTLAILRFVGLKPKNTKCFGGIQKNISKKRIEKILEKAEKYGSKRI
ncbi:NAD(P)H-dependent oxidoreductase [Candidatus Pacearchaeota archaeon]|nr:NAD(P)H-dependent oxidoreductase [Candidatus Pacearchaeota archaeon]